MQWPHVPTTTVPGWQGEAFTHNKQVEIAINSVSSSHNTSQILTQINGRRHKQFTLFIFLGFFLQLELPGWCPVGAADLLSEGAAHVRSPTPGTDQTWGGNQKWIDKA